METNFAVVAAPGVGHGNKTVIDLGREFLVEQEAIGLPPTTHTQSPDPARLGVSVGLEGLAIDLPEHHHTKGVPRTQPECCACGKGDGC